MEMEIVGSILNEVCTGHSLDSAQMTILMDVEQISSTTFTTPLFWFSPTVCTTDLVWKLECQSGEANGWRNREQVVLDLFSSLKMGKILW